jgi:hypothetical protein
VRLTEKGRHLVEGLLKTHGNQVHYLMRGLDPGEHQDLLLLLVKLGNHLDLISRGADPDPGSALMEEKE